MYIVGVISIYAQMYIYRHHMYLSVFPAIVDLVLGWHKGQITLVGIIILNYILLRKVTVELIVTPSCRLAYSRCLLPAHGAAEEVIAPEKIP